MPAPRFRAIGLAGGAHIGEAFQWSGAKGFDLRALAVAAVGVAAPVLAGLALGRPEAGFTIGLGAMLLAGEPATPDTAAARGSPTSAILPAFAATASATLIVGEPWTNVAMVVLAGLAATVSGYSRPVGVAAIRFLVYLVLSVTLLQNAGPDRNAAALLFALGALWNIAVRLMLPKPREQEAEAPPARTPTPAQRRAYWLGTLRSLAGWQFTIRIVVGLALAGLLRHLWPSHHFGWIVLTVALLTQRPIEHLPVKTTQRTLGALFGVGLTWAILSAAFPAWGVASIVCVLATAAAVARSGSYLLYAAISTPVILLVLDLGKRVETSLLADRLVATLLGAGIVVLANLALDLALRRAPVSGPRGTPSPSPSPRSRARPSPPGPTAPASAPEPPAPPR